MTLDIEKLAKQKYYKQSATGTMTTIGVPGEFFVKRYEIEPGFTMEYTDDTFYISEDLHLYHYMPTEKLWPMAKKILERMEKDPRWIQKRLKKTMQVVKGLEKLCFETLDAVNQADSAKIPSLLPLFKRFFNQTRAYWKETAFIDIFDPFQEEILTHVFGDRKDKIRRDDCQTLLLPEESVLAEEKKDFDLIRDLFEQVRRDKQNPKLKKALEKHAEKYWWIQNDYLHVTKLDAVHFAGRLNEKKAPEPENLPKQKKMLVKKYDLSPKILHRIRQFEELAYLRDVRKKFTQITNYGFIHLFHSLAPKLGIPEHESNFVFYYLEFERFMKKDPALMKEIALRAKNGVFIIRDSANDSIIIETKKAHELFERIEHRFKGGNIIYGNPASLGKAVGKAKIIKGQADFHKFHEGDILITAMTRPEFVPLMKKSSAIVTDEGGITSHAAIISRELGKPCIIGTQIATKTFKDNDLLEVDANHGSVRKVEK